MVFRPHSPWRIGIVCQKIKLEDLKKCVKLERGVIIDDILMSPSNDTQDTTYTSGTSANKKACHDKYLCQNRNIKIAFVFTNSHENAVSIFTFPFTINFFLPCLLKRMPQGLKIHYTAATTSNSQMAKNITRIVHFSMQIRCL